MLTIITICSLLVFHLFILGRYFLIADNTLGRSKLILNSTASSLSIVYLSGETKGLKDQPSLSSSSSSSFHTFGKNDCPIKIYNFSIVI